MEEENRAGTRLKYPLTKKALVESFQALRPDDVRVTEPKVEAHVDGEWAHSSLAKHFKRLGFKRTGPKESLAYVNDDGTVGLVLFGEKPHPTKNTWLRYSFEVQARPLAAVARAPGMRDMLAL